MLATAESLGAYQGTAGIRAALAGRARTRPRWSGFSRRYRAAVDWLYDRANREIVEALLVANIRDMTPALARQSYDLLLADKGGIEPRSRARHDGIRTVLALRSKYAVPPKTLDDPGEVRRPHVLREGVRQALSRERRMARRNASEPTIVRPDDIDPHHRWDRPLQAPGHTQVDFEERVNFRRLHDYRLARTRAALSQSGLGALLCFDQHNIRYITSTVIGEWARDKLTRYALLTGNGDPYIWDFGSAAQAPPAARAVAASRSLPRRPARTARRGRRRHHAVPRRGARDQVAARRGGRRRHAARRSTSSSRRCCSSCRSSASRCATASRRCLQAREVKNIDELTLLNMAAAMVDGVYQDIAEALKPGVKESEIVALATARLYEMGSDCVEAINSISGERCSPHPHNFTDRLIRPGDQAFFDIIQSFMGYRTCYYRTFNVGRATPLAARRLPQGARVDGRRDRPAEARRDVGQDRRSLPTAKDIGFASEMDAFGLNFCHGLGLGLHERPLMSRLNSLKEPIELKAGMVFAVETYCPASDGISAARIEEEVILTPTGPKIISLYPAEELPIANPY